MRTYTTTFHPSRTTEPTTRQSTFWLRTLLLAGLVVALCSPVVLADDTGWYVGVKAGQADVEAQLGDNFSQFVDGDDTALAAGIGYRFHQNFAIEAWYQDFGTFGAFGSPCADTAEGCAAVVVPTIAELEGVKVRALGYWPVAERFSVYGMVGALDWQTDVRTAFFDPFLGEFPIDSFDGTDFLYGAGLSLDISERFEAFAEYEVVDFDMEVPSVGLKYRF